MEKFPSVLQNKEIIELLDDFLEEEATKLEKFDKNKHKKIKNFFKACTVYGIAFLGTLSAKEALASGETSYKNVIEKNGFVEKMDESSFLEKDLTEKFVQEIDKIDENLPENEIEQAIQTEISRMELLLSSQGLAQGKNDSKMIILGERVKNVLEKQQVLTINSLKPKIKKVLEEMLSSSLIID